MILPSISFCFFILFLLSLKNHTHSLTSHMHMKSKSTVIDYYSHFLQKDCKRVKSESQKSWCLPPDFCQPSLSFHTNNTLLMRRVQTASPSPQAAATTEHTLSLSPTGSKTLQSAFCSNYYCMHAWTLLSMLLLFVHSSASPSFSQANALSRISINGIRSVSSNRTCMRDVNIHPWNKDEVIKKEKGGWNLCENEQQEWSRERKEEKRENNFQLVDMLCN